MLEQSILKSYPKNQDLDLYLKCFLKRKKWVYYTSVINTNSQNLFKLMQLQRSQVYALTL